MHSETAVQVRAEVRHQTALLLRDPGPFIAYVLMAMLLVTVTRPMYASLGASIGLPPASGTAQATAGMSIMFSLFLLKVAGAHVLNERTWHTWDRLRSSPAPLGGLLTAKALPLFAILLFQQAILLTFSALAFGLRPNAGWAVLALCTGEWSACVLLLGFAASTLAHTPAQLSASGDVFAIVMTVVGGALVPVVLLPDWLRHLAPISPGYWAMSAYRQALLGTANGTVRPLAVLVGFGLVGFVLGAMISRTKSMT